MHCDWVHSHGVTPPNVTSLHSNVTKPPNVISLHTHVTKPPKWNKNLQVENYSYCYEKALPALAVKWQMWPRQSRFHCKEKGLSVIFKKCDNSEPVQWDINVPLTCHQSKISTGFRKHVSNNKERASKTFLVISLVLVNDGEIGALERLERSTWYLALDLILRKFIKCKIWRQLNFLWVFKKNKVFHFFTLLFFWKKMKKKSYLVVQWTSSVRLPRGAWSPAGKMCHYC